MMFLPAEKASAQAWVQAVNNFDALVRNYNLVSFGNASFNGHDTEGGLAVKGNLTLSSVPVAAHHSAGADPTLFVSGKLTLQNDSHLNNGYASINPAKNGHLTVTGNQVKSSGGKLLLNANTSNPLTNAGPANWNWATIESQAISLSATLKNAAQTGTIAVNMANQTLTFASTTTAAGVVVFQLDASKLGQSSYNGINNVNNIAFNLAANQTAVVNVINANNKTIFSGYNFNDNGHVGDQLLWNFNGSGTVTIGSQGNAFFGSILAPQMTINNSNNRLDGQLIVKNLNYSGAELHFEEFAPIGVLVPEPSTYALWTIALCGAGLWWHRRRVRADPETESK
jgi:choice-of-anchor A domain-containing protein